jgi:hypothetical protein
LIRQFLTEGFVADPRRRRAGPLISLWAKNLLLIYYTTNSFSPVNYDLSLNPRTFAVRFGALRLPPGLLFACVPAIQASRQDLVRALKDESGAQSRRKSWVRSTLVIAPGRAVALPC